MNILVIDTSSIRCSAGIKYNNEEYIKFFDYNKTHSEKLLPLLDDVLKEAGIFLDKIDYVGVVVGPRIFYRH